MSRIEPLTDEEMGESIDFLKPTIERLGFLPNSQRIMAHKPELLVGINELYKAILDNPDFFWEDDEWLPVYSRVAKYLEVDRRADVLNKRLDILKELFDMLATELHNSHSNKLEWIVIILIMVEVLFQVIQIAMGMTA